MRSSRSSPLAYVIVHTAVVGCRAHGEGATPVWHHLVFMLRRTRHRHSLESLQGKQTPGNLFIRVHSAAGTINLLPVLSLRASNDKSGRGRIHGQKINSRVKRIRRLCFYRDALTESSIKSRSFIHHLLPDMVIIESYEVFSPISANVRVVCDELFATAITRKAALR